MSEKKLEAIVVDDQADVVDFLEKALIMKGIRVRKFLSPAQALEDFKTLGCDLIVLDLMMPGINGLEMVKKIREIDRNVAIVLTTGYYFADIKEVEHELSALLYKPFALRTLFETIEEIKLSIAERGRKNGEAPADRRPGRGN
jgi:two-component SAPR family response regulator